MKKISILIAIALMAIIYSCGNSGQGSNEQNTDSLATAEQVDNKQAQSEEQPSTTEQAETKIPDAELYKYFSKEEMSKKMQNALKTFENMKESFYAPELYIKLLKADGFVLSPKTIEGKWGKPEKQDNKTYDSPVKSGKKVHSYNYEYPYFTIEMNDVTSKWLPTNLTTNTPGFGFAGVYVCVPECNKDFIEKLFAKVNIQKDTENGVEKWTISLDDSSVADLTLEFNKSGTVKSMNYFATHYID